METQDHDESPPEPSARSTEQSSSDTQALSAPAVRILIAEDNRLNQQVILRLLKRLGYQADLVVNGKEAIAQLQQQPYDIILMDIQMPEMDGITATRYIRQYFPASAQPKIIAVTAQALPGDREYFLSTGMDAYISKPIHLRELEYVLRYMIQSL